MQIEQAEACSAAHRSNRPGHSDGLMLDRSAVWQLSSLSSRTKLIRMKVVKHLTCLTLSHPNGPAYSTSELLNTPLVNERLLQAPLLTVLWPKWVILNFIETRSVRKKFIFHTTRILTNKHPKLHRNRTNRRTRQIISDTCSNHQQKEQILALNIPKKIFH